MKLDKLVYEVLTELREMSDDSNITPSFVSQLIDEYRSKYIQQEFSKRNSVNHSSIQSFNVPLSFTDSSSYPSMPTGSTIIVSEPIPQLINLNRRPGIIRIRTIDKIHGEINFMTIGRAKESAYASFKTINAFLDTDNRLYLIGNKPSFVIIQNVTVDAVLEAPNDIVGWNYDGITPVGEVEDYPIDLGMWSYIKDDIIKSILLSYGVPVDNVNNEVDDKEVKGQGNGRKQG